MHKRPLMVGLGELLWDLLPSGRVLGGAPANFAYMSSLLGNEGIVASRVGRDGLGREAYEVMSRLTLNTSYLQYDDLHPTGTAGIVLDSAGQPKFTIQESVAWDFLDWIPSWEELALRTDVVCFGSLAQRSSVSAVTIDRFLKKIPQSAICICDANLRGAFYSEETLRTSFRRAHILKVNEEELFRIAALFNLDSANDEGIAERLIDQFELKLVCVTRGEKGSLLVSESRSIQHPGFRVETADAVGAGDAFTACLAHYYLLGAGLDEIIERANRMGAWVATQRGATPIIQQERMLRILDGSFD